MKRIISKPVFLTTLALGLVTPGEAESMRHAIAASEEGKFCGWPANNGVWTWDKGKEILVGYSYQDFVEQKGHNIKGLTGTSPDIITRLARSTDGGHTWTNEDPANFVGDGKASVPSPGGIDFKAPGFAMRVVGIGYHGAYDENGSFFVSYNRGKDWQGPYQFNGLMEDPKLKGKDNTSRTGYVVTGPDSCLLFMSTRGKESSDDFMDKTYVAETTDGGKTFRFVSWVIPPDDPFRAVMPAVSQLADGTIVATLRRRDLKDDKFNRTKPCWVDCYSSTDKGRTWSFTSRVGETGFENGNPPALATLHDGRIVCVYGNRSKSKMLARVSADGGKTWEAEVVLRDDFQPDKFGDKDLGYPRVAVNHENHIVALYYWATKERPQHHIPATIWAISPTDP
jgi:hypothetical protein